MLDDSLQQGDFEAPPSTPSMDCHFYFKQSYTPSPGSSFHFEFISNVVSGLEVHDSRHFPACQREVAFDSRCYV